MVTVLGRFESAGAFDLAASLRLREGTRTDYDGLAEYHYRAGRPATAMRVLVLESVGVSLGSRFAALAPRGTGAGRRVKCETTGGNGVGEGCGEVVGVLVESLPSLSCRMRDVALGHRYGSHLEPAERAVLLNAEVRCISRVVVDPRWRGLGLAGRLVREALKTATTPVTEALAAMGRVHPFFERAGMTAYPRPPHDFDVRLRDVLACLGVGPDALHDSRAVWSAVEALPASGRALMRRELNTWYRKNAGRGAGSERDPEKQLAVAAGRLGMEPVYYVKVNG